MSGAYRHLSVEEELALRLVGTRESRERTRDMIASLAERADKRRLRTLIAFYRMDALLGKRLMEATDSLPQSLTDELEKVRLREHYRGLAQELVTVRLAEVLETEGIPCLPLKGQTLSRTVHGDVGFRSSSDIDLLVDGDWLDRACTVLRAHSYGAPLDSEFEHGLPLLHYRLLSVHRALPSVELHWRVHWHESGFSKRLLDRSERDRECGRRAQPDDELASLLLFYAREGFAGLRLLADISAWWDVRSHELPGDGLARVVSGYPEVAPALRAAAAVAERLAGVPAGRLWQHAGLAGRRERLATRMADLASSSDPDQVAADQSLVDGLLSPPGAGRVFLRRQLVGRAGGDAVVHLLKVIARAGLALWQLRGGRSWTPTQEELDDARRPAETRTPP